MSHWTFASPGEAAENAGTSKSVPHRCPDSRRNTYWRLPTTYRPEGAICLLKPVLRHGRECAGAAGKAETGLQAGAHRFDPGTRKGKGAGNGAFAPFLCPRRRQEPVSNRLKTDRLAPS